MEGAGCRPSVPALGEPFPRQRPTVTAAETYQSQAITRAFMCTGEPHHHLARKVSVPILQINKVRLLQCEVYYS